MVLENFKHYLFGEEVFIGKEISDELALKYFDREFLEGKSKAFSKTSIDSILYVLQETAYKIADCNGQFFKEVMAKLPKNLNYSDSMVKAGLDILPEILAIETLKGRLKPLGDYKCLDTFVKEEGCKKAVPMGSLVHVCAGNIFLGAIDSLVLGIITKNINVVKVSSEDCIFPVIFYEALKEVDKENIVTPYVAITYWSHDNNKVDNIIKNNFDGILLFGGEEAVISYKSGLSHKTELYAFGPKISFGVVSNELSPKELEDVANGFADDIVFWEQRACTSCQNIFLEKGTYVDKFIDSLYKALEQKGKEFPQNNLQIDEAVEIRKEREMARWLQFNGEGRVLEGKTSNHTIIVGSGYDIKNSPLNRTIYVNLVDDYKDLLNGNIKYLKYYMSTVAVGFRETSKVIDDFVDLGVKRFCKPGSMSTKGEADKPHDGIYLPNLLVRFINTEDLDSNKIGIEYIDSEHRDKLLIGKLNNLIVKAMASPFYKELYRDVKLPLKSLEEFKKVPILTKNHLYDNGLDSGNSMLTSDLNHAYIFSAGGTTGKMKYVAYSNEEFTKSKKVFGLGFKALGINEKDRVVNYMKAGALWTAFSAVNKGLEETGCTILSLTANQCEKDTINYIKIFKPNVIMGLPSNIILLAQEAKSMGEHIEIEKIYYSGEHLSEQGREFIQSIFNPRIIASLGYAAVETGPIGFQCEHCKDKEHHVCDEWAYVECNEEGEAIVTALERELNPIIRYKLGDKVELIDEPCKCGRTSKRFRLLGRTDDVIRFNVSDLHLNEIYKSIENINEVSSNFQISIDNLKEKRAITFNVEKKNFNPIEEDKVKNEILNKLMMNCKSISKDRELNLIEKIHVKVLEPNTIKRMERTGKIKRIVDNRI